MKRPCPKDAARIPQVAECLDGAEPVRFFWCRFCMELFGFVGDPPNERVAAGFGHDEVNGWRIFREVDTKRDVESAVVSVTQIPPQS